MIPSSSAQVANEPEKVTERDAGRLTVGVSGLYLGLYIHYGFFAFLPLWLKSTGAGPEEIGILMAIPLILRLLTVAPFSAWVGRLGRVRDAIAYTALGSAAVILLLLGEPAHAGRIAIVIVFSIIWDQLPVLTDAYAVMAVRSRKLPNGSAISSTTTNRFSFSIFSSCNQYAMAFPLRFINVVGLMR